MGIDRVPIHTLLDLSYIRLQYLHLMTWYTQGSRFSLACGCLQAVPISSLHHSVRRLYPVGEKHRCWDIYK